jgi:hypothetical protein
MTQKHPDGTVQIQQPDGTITEKHPDGTTQVQQPDGSYRKVFSDGQGFEFDAQSGKATRRSTDGFAVQVLYDENSSTAPTAGSGLAAAKMLKVNAMDKDKGARDSSIVSPRVMFRRNSGCLFERKGISLRAMLWLADLADEHQTQKVSSTATGKTNTPPVQSSATTQDVCDVILKATAAQKCSWVQWLASSSERSLRDVGLSLKDVGVATVFVSHAWRYQFRSVMLHAVESQHGKPASQEEPQDGEDYYWIDVATVNQHLAGAYPQDWWSNTFRTGIGVIGKTVLVLSPWNDPIPLKRSWCLWEILNSCEEKVAFEIVIPPSEKRAFKQSLVTKWSEVVETMTKVDIENAQAWRPDDQTMIASAVRRTKGGFAGLNTRVKNMLRTWLADTGCEQLALTLAKREKGEDWGRPDEEALSLHLQQVGRLLIEQGKAEKAVTYLRQSVQLVRELTGEDSERFAKACHFLAWALRQQDNVEEATIFAKQSHAALSKLKGPRNADTESAAMNLWMLQAEASAQSIRLPVSMIAPEVFLILSLLSFPHSFCFKL